MLLSTSIEDIDDLAVGTSHTRILMPSDHALIPALGGGRLQQEKRRTLWQEVVQLALGPRLSAGQ